MAFGFKDDNDELHEVIKEASRTMLLYAAHSDDSNAGSIYYPARYSDHVFGIFSTDANIKSSSFNPTNGLPNYNFATLGEGVSAYEDGDFVGEQKETSYSTAIAAGLAGRILQFSRHADSQRCEARIANIHTKYGMTKVFRAMAVEDGGYYCLKPWKLLPEDM